MNIARAAHIILIDVVVFNLSTALTTRTNGGARWPAEIPL
jgi:hypothetical protein